MGKVLDRILNRDNLMLQIISFFWLLGKLWSFGAWSVHREFPRVSLVGDLPYLAWIILFSEIGCIICLITVIVRPKKLFIIAILISEITLIFSDYLLNQPWSYLYFLLFLIAVVFWNDARRKRYLWQLVLASVYLFSGLHKFSRTFLETFWKNVFLEQFLGLSEEKIITNKLFFIGLSIPIVETALALMVLLGYRSGIATKLLIAMHIFILLVLGPLGIQYNSIIWIWNIAMICILILQYPFTIKKYTLHLGWYIWIFGLPSLCIITGMPSALSFNLYSGKNDKIYVYRKGKFDSKIPSFPLETNEDGYLNCFAAQDWAMKETTLPPNPERWYMKKLAEEMRRTFPKDKVIVISYNGKEIK